MKTENLEKILVKLEDIEKRLVTLEESTATELRNLQSTMDLLAIGQQEDIVATLQRVDAKLTAILETQKLNVEILKVFSGDLVQH